MSGKDKLISVEHLKWNVGGIKCGTLTVDYLNWILDHEEPAVDAEPVRHGKWANDAIGVLRCSECKTQAPWKYGRDYIDYRWKANYCPNCGARMDKE